MKTTASEKTAAVMGRIKSSYPRIQHILVPLDFSGKSRQALRYAVPLAEKFAAVVHLVHVLPPPTKSEQADLPRRKHAAIKRLGDMAALLPPRLRTGNAVLLGKPADEILALARRNNIDLIVLTTKGRTGLARALVGSTAESIMRHAPCPVLSVRRR
ncbi:MAG TPA: universal stress protein [Lacunisphaera sp.]|jgi:universal stress protein A|nr:universal stress protein [Lacunisphaera sp.]HQY06602.1 universal stress protein [Lacunisphaera sp.]